MGRYITKCKGLGEVAVMEVAQVGVRTRARALAMATENSGTTKRRKAGGGELKFSSSLVQFRRSRRVVVTPENSVSQANSGNSRRRTASNDPCPSPSSDHLPASCCSSNGSTDVVKESLNFVDLDEESGEIEISSTYNFDRRERRERTRSSMLRAEPGEQESTARPGEAKSRSGSAVEKMPSEAELEEFFSAAEKGLQNRFTEKYNYDIVKDVPLEGRYEWVRVKP